MLRRMGKPEDELTCPIDVSRYTPRVRRPTATVTTPSGHTVKVRTLKRYLYTNRSTYI